MIKLLKTFKIIKTIIKKKKSFLWIHFIKFNLKLKIFYPIIYILQNNFFFKGFRIGYQEENFGIKIG